MKKLLVVVIALICLSSGSAFAEEGFKALKFVSATGESFTVEANDLEIYFLNGNVSFNNTELTIPSSSLISMEFTDEYDEPTGIDKISIEKDTVEVFRLDGKLAGIFATAAEAVVRLDAGVYIIKDSKGNSIKITVGK